MATQSTPATALPHYIDEALTMVGFRWKLDPAHPLDALRAEGKIQVREEAHIAPREAVKRYTAALAGGAVFPPLVVTRDGAVVDGNTRIAAALANQRHDFPAVVLDVDEAEADPNQRARLRVLGAILNQNNGVSLTRGEVRTTVESALSLGWTIDNIARFYGIPRNAVRGAKREVAALDRMGALAIEPNGTRAGTLRSIGDFAGLHDEPFAALVNLTKDAGLTANEIKALGTEIEKAGSDAKAMARLEAERAERAEQIAAHKATGKAALPPSQRIRMIVGQLLRDDFVNSPGSCLERRPEREEDYVATIELAIDFLDTLRRLQTEEAA